MSGEENGYEPLKAFEAALGSLVPRRDRLDPQWRDFLAKAASLAAGIAADEGASPPQDDPQAGRPWSWMAFCAECQAQPMSARRRWAWPAAFSAMTTVAAVLLVMLVSRPGPQIVEVPAPVDAVPRAAPPEDRDVPPAPSSPGSAKTRELVKDALRRPWTAYREPAAAPYSQLLAVELEGHFDASAPPVAGSAEDWQMARAPLSCRELWESLLNEPGPDNPLGPPPANQPSTFEEPDHESA